MKERLNRLIPTRFRYTQEQCRQIMEQVQI